MSAYRISIATCIPRHSNTGVRAVLGVVLRVSRRTYAWSSTRRDGTDSSCYDRRSRFRTNLLQLRVPEAIAACAHVLVRRARKAKEGNSRSRKGMERG